MLDRHTGSIVTHTIVILIMATDSKNIPTAGKGDGRGIGVTQS